MKIVKAYKLKSWMTNLFTVSSLTKAGRKGDWLATSILTTRGTLTSNGSLSLTPRREVLRYSSDYALIGSKIVFDRFFSLF